MSTDPRDTVLLSYFYSPIWHCASRYKADICPEYYPWLVDTASLTQKLIHRCGDRFRVEVLSQKVGPLLFDDRQALALSQRRWGLLREVVLYGAQAPWVYARTVIPLSTLKGPLGHLRHLGDQPLGACLFSHPKMRRGSIEVTKLVARQARVDRALPVWGRRSVFTLSDKPLLVSEFFFDELLRY